MAKRTMPEGHYKVMQERARKAMKNKTDKLEKAAAGYDTSYSRFFIDGRRVWEPTIAVIGDAGMNVGMRGCQCWTHQVLDEMARKSWE